MHPRKESLAFSANKTDPTAPLCSGSRPLSELERSDISGHLGRGDRAGEKAGKYTGQLKTVSGETVTRCDIAGESKIVVTASLGISRSTLYRCL